MARPEALTFLGPLALAFAEDFLTGGESFCAMVVLPSLTAILAVCPRRDPNQNQRNSRGLGCASALR